MRSLKIGILVLAATFPSSSSGGEIAPIQGKAEKPQGLLNKTGKPYSSQFFDEEDGWLDVSGFLDRPFGFIPLVTPITEPAVGSGAALGPVFIDRPEGGGRPNMVAAGAMRTSNGSEGIFGAYSGYLLDQKLHLLAGGMDMSVNLDFNGLGKDLQIEGELLRYNLDTAGGMLGAGWRLGDSKWPLGARYAYAEVDASFVRYHGREQEVFQKLGLSKEQRDRGIQSVVSSIQATLNFDSRDNPFTPTQGVYSELGFTVNDEVLGGSDDYQLLNWTTMWYQPIVEGKLFFGVRGDLFQSFGDVPLYRRPFVQLRGLPAMDVQGNGVAFAEAEVRWQFHRRFSVVGFGGVGTSWSGGSPFRRSNVTVTGGVGLRYLIARKHGLHMGLDVGFSEEGPALYIQFGSGWLRS